MVSFQEPPQPPMPRGFTCETWMLVRAPQVMHGWRFVHFTNSFEWKLRLNFHFARRRLRPLMRFFRRGGCCA